MPNDDLIQQHLKSAWARAADAREEARSLNRAGFSGPAYVWAMRAAEMLMREFVLAPHYLQEGLSWEKAMRRGAKDLGQRHDWRGAFAKAEDWFGPFDEPLTENDENAWAVWSGRVDRRRGELVHGAAVHQPDSAETDEVIAFAEQMATWYSLRFLASERHPIGQTFRAIWPVQPEGEHGD